MLINYNKPNVLTLPLTTKDKATAGSVMLVPGINEIPKDTWARLEKLPKIERLIKSKHVTVELPVDDTEEDFALGKASIADAAKIVKKTWNILLLEEWAAGEARAGVVKAIHAQIKLVEDKTRPKKKVVNE